MCPCSMEPLISQLCREDHMIPTPHYSHFVDKNESG